MGSPIEGSAISGTRSTAAAGAAAAVAKAHASPDAVLAGQAASRWCGSAAKRLFDIAGAAVLLPVVFPLLLVVAAAVFISSHGPVLFVQKRLGRHGQLFRIYKFRTLYHEGEAGPALTRTHDDRQTRIGRWLRESKLDELPQLWNILRGDMSLVGPRPHLPQLWDASLPGASEVLAVRPGLTSPAALDGYREHEQLAKVGAYEEIETYYMKEMLPEKMQQNLAYLCRASFGSDLAILSRTISFSAVHLFTTLKRTFDSR